MGYNELINECSPHDAMGQPPAYQTAPSTPEFNPAPVVQVTQPRSFATDQQLLDVGSPLKKFKRFSTLFMGSGKWKVGLVESCFSLECCKAYWCPCCSLADTSRELGLDYDRTFWFTFFCWHAMFPIAFQHRELIRQRHGIIGSGCDDFCTLLWCAQCVLAQHHLHMKK
ncbi:Oidioi.mRNA.OKI2018_I69.chr1.g2726.t1.cds [Oikopleura dioica]|uniref:Oidioi.mRNA.OKI2018_I69.chr1.g2726.t1.cds n=1 Tax=Oikopleura dioica TaxID=34765 RepID=A0ABN7SVH2_OIKDI|nr:Oidioi.mRNA.OKI2018_I69.chr1.g2726.t1.cds [Oikopleura dioica]